MRSWFTLHVGSVTIYFRDYAYFNWTKIFAAVNVTGKSLIVECNTKIKNYTDILILKEQVKRKKRKKTEKHKYYDNVYYGCCGLWKVFKFLQITFYVILTSMHETKSIEHTPQILFKEIIITLIMKWRDEKATPKKRRRNHSHTLDVRPIRKLWHLMWPPDVYLQ